MVTDILTWFASVDWYTIVYNSSAIVLSGIIGVLITIRYSERSAVRQMKLRLLQQLLGNRHDLRGPAFTEALNQVFVVFDKSKPVIKALREFHAAITSIERNNEVMDNKLVQLIREICRDAKIRTKGLDDSFFMRPFNTVSYKDNIVKIIRTEEEFDALKRKLRDQATKYKEQAQILPSQSLEQREAMQRALLFTEHLQFLHWLTSDKPYRSSLEEQNTSSVQRQNSQVQG